MNPAAATPALSPVRSAPMKARMQQLPQQASREGYIRAGDAGEQYGRLIYG